MKTKQTGQTVDELVRIASLGGPGLDGYVYQADTYCVHCGCSIIEDILKIPNCGIHSENDLAFNDSDELPQPIFFGESDCSQYCATCGEYLYGPETEGE